MEDFLEESTQVNEEGKVILQWGSCIRNPRRMTHTGGGQGGRTAGWALEWHAKGFMLRVQGTNHWKVSKTGVSGNQNNGWIAVESLGKRQVLTRWGMRRAWRGYVLGWPKSPTTQLADHERSSLWPALLGVDQVSSAPPKKLTWDNISMFGVSARSRGPHTSVVW